MRYESAAWEKERAGWRSVVQLNVVRSIVTILGVLKAEMNGDVPCDVDDETDSDSDTTRVDDTLTDDADILRFTDRHQLLMIKLAPLRGIEAELKRQLGSGTEPIQQSTPFDTPTARPRRRTL